jgi:hypothetical protein
MERCAGERQVMRTPAQVSGRYDFVEDVPVQGPTDEGIRAADCWWTQNVLPVKSPACVDCKGPVPIWANNPSAWGGGPTEYGGDGGSSCVRGWGGDLVYRDGRQVAGFSLNASGDPASALASDQQGWVVSALVVLNQKILAANPGNSCQSWQDPSTNLAAAVGCFQIWYNANSGGSLRTDGVLDEDTLCALVATTTAHPQDFQTPFPDPSGQHCQGAPINATAPVPAPAPATATPAAPAAPASPAAVAPIMATTPTVVPAPEKRKLSTGAMVGIGVASAVVVGGVIYAATGGVRRRHGRR